MRVTKKQKMCVEELSTKFFRLRMDYDWDATHISANSEVTFVDVERARGELSGYVAACMGLMPSDISFIGKTWAAIGSDGHTYVTGVGSTINWHV